MFKIYDLNMKELPFPEGVKPLDIFVSSVNKRRLTEEFEGRSGALNYGYDYGGRSVDLSLWLEAHDTIDYRLIRNELYAFFDTHDVFYIEETRVPSRVLKVTIDESYIPERINQTHSSVEISCRTLDSVFWESKYTTIELNDSGYSATAEKYGLVDNIDDEKVKYRFEDEKEVLQTIDLTDFSYIYGFISGTGSVSQVGTASYTINEGFIGLVEGSTYRFIDRGYNPQLSYWWLYMYDDDESLIERTALSNIGGGREYTFIARGTKMKVMINPISPMFDNRINPARIGIDVLPELNLLGATKFEVYNAGNVAVEPESMMLNITVNAVQSTNNFTIRNKTTGEEIVLKRASAGNDFRIRGMVISLGSITNIFRDTNRSFISLAPGNNQFEVLNGAFDEVSIDFKNYYK